MLSDRPNDQSREKILEQQLAVEREQFRGAFDTSAIGMAIVGLDGRWIEVNNSLLSILGYSREDLHQLTFQDVTHPDDLEADLDLVQQLLANKKDNYQLEKRYYHQQGHIVWVLLSVSIVRDHEGKPLHFVSQIIDITESKKISHLRLAETDNNSSRIALELHENIAQTLASIRMYLGSSLSAKIYQDRDLNGVDQQLSSVIGEIKSLTARITPTTFLYENIKALIEDLVLRYHLQHSLQVELNLDEFPDSEKFRSNYHLFRIVENYLKLAVLRNAKIIRLNMLRDKTLIVGIDKDGVKTSASEARESLLLEDIKTRVEILNGLFRNTRIDNDVYEYVIAIP